MNDLLQNLGPEAQVALVVGALALIGILIWRFVPTIVGAIFGFVVEYWPWILVALVLTGAVGVVVNVGGRQINIGQGGAGSWISQVWSDVTGTVTGFGSKAAGTVPQYVDPDPNQLPRGESQAMSLEVRNPSAGLPDLPYWVVEASTVVSNTVVLTTTQYYRGEQPVNGYFGYEQDPESKVITGTLELQAAGVLVNGTTGAWMVETQGMTRVQLLRNWTEMARDAYISVEACGPFGICKIDPAGRVRLVEFVDKIDKLAKDAQIPTNDVANQTGINLDELRKTIHQMPREVAAEGFFVPVSEVRPTTEEVRIRQQVDIKVDELIEVRAYVESFYDSAAGGFVFGESQDELDAMVFGDVQMGSAGLLPTLQKLEQYTLQAGLSGSQLHNDVVYWLMEAEKLAGALR